MLQILIIISHDQDWLWAAIFTLFCMAIDVVMLLLLPRLRLSFGPIGLPLAIFSFGRIGLFAVGALFRQTNTFTPPDMSWLPILICLLQFVLTILALYGLYVEPFRLTVTELYIESVQFFSDRPLRVLQISDLHVERLTSRELNAIAQSELLAPDLIVLTGDYLNLDYRTDPLAIRDARILLSKLHAPLGVYAIQGSPEVDLPNSMTALFDGLPICVLNNEVEKLSLPAHDLYLVGIPVGPGDVDQLEQCSAHLPQNGYKLLLYHTPDLVHRASTSGVDLYLAGHTHGGQIRIPIFGAIVTASKYWKCFESGKHVVGRTTLYVSRGIGMEGMHMPRIRFLAPPELVMVNLGKIKVS